MQDTTQNFPPLVEYIDPAELQQRLEHTFPTPESLRWFIRQNKAPLANAGALILVAGRHKMHPDLTERFVIENGRKAAVRSDAA